MNIGDITIAVNNLADEDFSSSQITQFVNDAIARINIECQANFEFFGTDNAANWTCFPDKWQRTLFIPFVVGRMKAVDASQFEYNDNYSEFVSNLVLFKSKYQIPVEYQDANEKTSFVPDFTGNYYNWSGNGSNGSDPLS